MLRSHASNAKCCNRHSTGKLLLKEFKVRFYKQSLQVQTMCLNVNLHPLVPLSAGYDE